MFQSWREYYEEHFEEEFKGTKYEEMVNRELAICDELTKKYLGKRMTFYEMDDKLHPMNVAFKDCINDGRGQPIGGTVIGLTHFNADDKLERELTEKYGGYDLYSTRD